MFYSHHIRESIEIMIGFTEHWNEYFDRIPAELLDLYFREEYVRLYETESEKACCFVYEAGDSIMLSHSCLELLSTREQYTTILRLPTVMAVRCQTIIVRPL